MQLFFKRAKIFLKTTKEGKELRFTTGVTQGPVQVPDWVKDTHDYRLGIADGSIVNVTPVPQPDDPPATEEEPEEEEPKAPEPKPPAGTVTAANAPPKKVAAKK